MTSLVKFEASVEVVNFVTFGVDNVVVRFQLQAAVEILDLGLFGG